MLKHDGLWSSVSGYSLTDNSDGTAKVRREEKILSKIIVSLDKSIYPYVMQAKTAAEAWKGFLR